MSSIMLIILIIASHLIPSNVNTCQVEMDGREMTMTRDAENNWTMKQVKLNADGSVKKVKEIPVGNVKGLKLSVPMGNGKTREVDTSSIFGVKSVAELKALTELAVGRDKLKLVKSDNSFVLKKNDKEVAKVTWINKKK